ncbi:MAG: universal stress protein [Deltaproteobacteria bacterium]|nr:universal stress protein [Deltaproteobacteria bacterium]MBW2296699.1 universal stress protein [Deltaproteobacteria bacterium]
MKIMVCYEDSSTSRDTVRLAQKHAAVWKGEIEVVSTITREEPIKHSRLREREDKFESQIRELFEDVDVPYKMQLLVNSMPAGEQLVRYSTRKNVDYVCLGIKKRSKVGKLIFGSTAQYVILNAPCPVLTTG